MTDASTEHAQLVQRIGLPIHQGKFWLKLLGGLSIVYGVLMALSIIGIVVAWLPIWMGILLYQAATLVDKAWTSGDEAAMIASLDKIRLYFTIMGVLALIGLVLGLIGFSFGLLGVIASLMQG